jgi:hypothetical protein
MAKLEIELRTKEGRTLEVDGLLLRIQELTRARFKRASVVNQITQIVTAEYEIDVDVPWQTYNDLCLSLYNFLLSHMEVSLRKANADFGRWRIS